MFTYYDQLKYCNSVHSNHVRNRQFTQLSIQLDLDQQTDKCVYVYHCVYVNLV